MKHLVLVEVHAGELGHLFGHPGKLIIEGERVLREIQVRTGRVERTGEPVHGQIFTATPVGRRRLGPVLKQMAQEIDSVRDIELARVVGIERVGAEHPDPGIVPKQPEQDVDRIGEIDSLIAVRVATDELRAESGPAGEHERDHENQRPVLGGQHLSRVLSQKLPLQSRPASN